MRDSGYSLVLGLTYLGYFWAPLLRPVTTGGQGEVLSLLGSMPSLLGSTLPLPVLPSPASQVPIVPTPRLTYFEGKPEGEVVGSSPALHLRLCKALDSGQGSREPAALSLFQ